MILKHSMAIAMSSLGFVIWFLGMAFALQTSFGWKDLNNWVPFLIFLGLLLSLRWAIATSKRHFLKDIYLDSVYLFMLGFLYQGAIMIEPAYPAQANIAKVLFGFMSIVGMIGIWTIGYQIGTIPNNQPQKL